MIEHSYGGSFHVGRGPTARSFGTLQELLHHAPKIMGIVEPCGNKSVFVKRKGELLTSDGDSYAGGVEYRFDAGSANEKSSDGGGGTPPTLTFSSYDL